MRAVVRIAPTGWKDWNIGVLFRVDIKNFTVVTLPHPYTWGWAGEEEIREIDRHPEAITPTGYAKKAARGHKCLFIKQGKQIVSYIWFKLDSCCYKCGLGPGEELRFCPLSKRQAFSYDLFTYRKYRGRILGMYMIQTMFLALQEQGINEVYSYVSMYNKPSLRMHLRLHAKPLRMVYLYRIRNWYRVFYGPEQDPRLAQWLDRFKPVKRNARRGI